MKCLLKERSVNVKNYSNVNVNETDLLMVMQTSPKKKRMSQTKINRVIGPIQSLRAMNRITWLVISM